MRFSSVRPSLGMDPNMPCGCRDKNCASSVLRFCLQTTLRKAVLWAEAGDAARAAALLRQLQASAAAAEAAHDSSLDRTKKVRTSSNA